MFEPVQTVFAYINMLKRYIDTDKLINNLTEII